VVHLDARDGDAERYMVGLSAASIDEEFRLRGQVLFVDTDDQLKVWGLSSQRKDLIIPPEKEVELKRFLIARAVRVGG
jgi:hypothetical protein